MLRKDVKLGFAIGGVMLAVLVVYVLVVPGTDKKTASLVTDESQNPASATPADKPSTDKPSTDKPAVVDVKPDAGTVKPVVADKPATTDKPAVADSTKPDSSNPTAPGNSTSPGTTSPNIWDTALNTGQLPPTMMTTQTPEAKTNHVILASTAGNDSGSKPAVADKPAVDPQPVGDKPAGDNPAVDKPVSENTKPIIDPVKPDAPTAGRTHVVAQGETLTSIAIAVYSDAKQWKRIAEANPKLNPNRLRVGTTIVIPDAAAPAASDSATPASSTTPGSHAATAIDPQTQYQVQANDNLYSIAMKLYGKPSYVDKIYQANKDTIGENPAHLKLHMVLKLPEAPTITVTTAVAH